MVKRKVVMQFEILAIRLNDRISRKGAKAQRKQLIFSLRLCAFAGNGLFFFLKFLIAGQFGV